MGRYESLAIVVLCCIGTIHSQENAKRSIPPSLIECYDDELNAKYNLLPHTMEIFIAIIRKIEKYTLYRADLRQLSTAILHRFRQDGIEMNPEVRPQAGIMPYAPLGKQFYRHAQTLRIVPGSAVNFPNDSISAVERCTLHSMLSSSIDKYKHPGDPRGCRAGNYGSNYGFYRFPRAAQGPKDDVETLSPEQIEMMTSKDQIDPNSKYPAFPPNHPSGSARLTDDQLSECPIESGVLKTPWGSVSGGSVLAGIAAGMEPQTIRIGELIKQQVEPRVFNDLDTNANLDNKFLATLAGDLAEVALAQGPHSRGQFSVGAEGTWNSTTRPIYHFLGRKDDLQMTGAEIRGDLDGLILANQVPEWQRRINSLRLSQVLELYYSDRGLFDPKVRACNRRAHLPTIAPTDTLNTQTHSSAIVLSSVGYATVTILPEMIKSFSDQAVKDFSSFVPSMDKDNNCDTGDHTYARATSGSSANSKPAVDLTVIVDTNWPFHELQPVVSQILTGFNINEYGSNFTIINGFDGTTIVNSSDSILDFAGKFNVSIYDRLVKGFNLAQSVEQLRNLQTWKLDEEKRRSLAGGKSDVVVIMPHHGNLNPSDRDFVLKSFEDMRRDVPDARVLFLTNGQKDVWAELVQDSDDVISINYSENIENNPAIDAILTRIKQVPRRLINTQCGSNYESSGNSRELDTALGPNDVNFYRIHPNYFISDDSDKPKLKIQSFGSPLKICWSRELLHVNASSARMSATCNNIVGNTQTIDMDCEGASYINQCKPYYLSVESNSNSSGKFDCLERKFCAFPDDIKYRISFERLVCKSGASTLLVAPLVLLATLARLFI